MIDNIVISNFQSHKKTTLQLLPGTNTIVGSSDSGKSAILRAINWVANNKPSGDSFRSNFGGDTKVTIKINDNVIERIRTDKDNSYKLNDEEYKAFGQDVPEEIKKIINFSDVNLQYQMDPPFLLSRSNGEIAKYINEIIDLTIIDRSLGKVEKNKRFYVKNLEVERDLLKKNQNQISKYNNLTELEDKLIGCETLSNNIKDKKEKVQKLLELTDKINNIKATIDKINTYLNVEKNVNDLENHIIDLQSKQNKYCLLNEKIEQIKLTENMIIQNNIKLERTKEKFENLMPNTCPLCGSAYGKAKNT